MGFDNVLEKLRSAQASPAETPDAPSEEAPQVDLDLEALPVDPEPSRKRKNAPRAVAARVTAAQKREVKDALTMMITLPAGIASFRDPVCAGAVLDHVDNVVDKLLPIICRNPRLLEWFLSGAGYMDWFALISALAPIGKTIWAHHVSKSIGHEEEEERSANGPDFSGYRAPVFAAP